MTIAPSPDWRLSHPSELPNCTTPTLMLRVTDTRHPAGCSELLIQDRYPDHQVHYRVADSVVPIPCFSRLTVSADLTLCAGPKSLGVLSCSESDVTFLESLLSRQAPANRTSFRHVQPLTGALLSVVSGVMVILFLSFASNGYENFSPFGRAFLLAGAGLSAIVSFVVAFTAARPRSHYIGLTLVGFSCGVVIDAILLNPIQPNMETREYLLEMMSFWSTLTVPVVAGHVIGRFVVWLRQGRLRYSGAPGEV